MSINKIKSIDIENESWEKIDSVIKKWRSENANNFQKPGELISSLLEKHSKKEVDFKPFKEENKKAKKVELSDKSLEIYESLPKGTKAYVVNGLLRTWIRDNS